MEDVKNNQKKENALIAKEMKFDENGIALGTLKEMQLWAETMVASGLVPRHFDTPAKVIVVLQAGRELGFKPWQSLQCLHVVEGQVGIRSDAIGGLIRKSGLCDTMNEFFEGTFPQDDFKAVVTSKRKDDPIEHRTEFSVADAKRAGLWDKKTYSGKDSVWIKHPKDMMLWRAMSKHGRRYYGDVTSGLYTVDELAEFVDEKDGNVQADIENRMGSKKIEATVIPPSSQVKEEVLQESDDFMAGINEQPEGTNA